MAIIISAGIPTFGTSENDTIFGREETDIIFGGGGSDLIFGRGGNDTITGGNLTGIGGNDVIFGGDGNDTLYGEFGNDYVDGGAGDDRVDGAGTSTPQGPGGSSRGANEIDILAGGAGKDTFVLAGSSFVPDVAGNGPYYRFAGNNDYALITDFNPHKDVILLARSDTLSQGSAVTVEYSLGAVPNGLPPGTGIFVNNLGEKPDLIAILQGVEPNSLSLSKPYFQWV